MLEHLPSGLGRALSKLRPGLDAVSLRDEAVAGAPGGIVLGSDAFADGGALPVGCTADGAGASPPLRWSGLPPGAAELALIVEDADSPTPAPLVHAIVLGLRPTETGLPEAALASPAGEGEGRAMGRNSYLSGQWLPPDPPPGHGPHRYVFQLFALSAPLALEGTPGRGAVLRAMRGKVLATGHLVGTHERA